MKLNAYKRSKYFHVSRKCARRRNCFLSDNTTTTIAAAAAAAAVVVVVLVVAVVVTKCRIKFNLANRASHNFSRNDSDL
jgi:hypothetical protein